MPVLLLGLALWTRLYRLDWQPLWLDEGATWATVTGNRLGTLIRDLVRPTQAYPLYHVVMKLDTRLLGDGEWALRLPSAVAGALAVPAIYALGRELRGWVLGLGAALLLIVSPFAIWQAQDAKAYSLTLLVVILLALTLARAIRRGTLHSWLVFAAVALVAPFVHRLLVFSLLGAAIVWALTTRHRLRRWVLGGALVAAVGVVGALVVSLRAQNAGGQYSGTGPLSALWLTFGQFAVGQWPGAVRRLWLVPCGLLTLAGGLRLALDLRSAARRSGALVILILGGLPALLFVALLVFQPLYEARYFTIVLPFWVLAVAWALPETGVRGQGSGVRGQGSKDEAVAPIPDPRSPIPASRFSVSLLLSVLGSMLFAGALLLSGRALFLPGKGLFSGAIVKENYRDMVRELAERVHPDDLVIVHPDSVVALYSYYAGRVADHPLPAPKTFYWLGRSGDFKVRELERELLPELQKYRRAWLVIAPAHAAVVDPPKPGDELGLIGLAFQYGNLNRRFLCGTPNADQSYDASVGVKLYCNAMPDYGQIGAPAVQQPIMFGDRVRFLGYTLRPFSSGVHPGGTLPITLYWSPTQSLEGSDYRMFVHVTALDNPKPLAQIDGQPLEGGLPTALWTKPDDTIHDERTIALVNVETGEPLPPGRYLLRVGVWDANNDGKRLAATGTAQPMIDDAVVVGEFEVLPR